MMPLACLYASLLPGLLLPTASDAFAPPPPAAESGVSPRRRLAYPGTTAKQTTGGCLWSGAGSPFGTGWDNDNFLDSLAGGGAPPPDEDDEDEYDFVAGLAAHPEEAERSFAEESWGGGAAGGMQQQEQQQQTSWGAAGPADAGGDSYSSPQQQQQQNEPQQPMIQKQEVGALPLGWSAHLDPSTRNLYYYNVADGTTTWEKPEMTASDAALLEEQQGTGGAGASYKNPIGGGGGAAGGGQSPEDDDADEILPDESIEGADLTADMKHKMKMSHTPDEEHSGGGTKFRALMARTRASQKQAARPLPELRPMEAVIPPEAMDRPVEEKARYIQESLWRQQHPEIADLPAQSYLPSGIGIDGKRIGRNRDNDIISNSGDVYFARLRRDSTLRNLARYAGDHVKANEVLTDPTLEEFQLPVENPFLTESKRDRERGLMGLGPEEMRQLMFQQEETYGQQEQPPDDPEAMRSASGISYKEKLAQAQARKLEESSSSSSETEWQN